MSKPSRKKSIHGDGAGAITPANYPSRVECLTYDKKVFHAMRAQLGKQSDMIAAMKRSITELQKTVEMLRQAYVQNLTTNLHNPEKK